MKRAGLWFGAWLALIPVCTPCAWAQRVRFPSALSASTASPGSDPLSSEVSGIVGTSDVLASRGVVPANFQAEFSGALAPYPAAPAPAAVVPGMPMPQGYLYPCNQGIEGGAALVVLKPLLGNTTAFGFDLAGMAGPLSATLPANEYKISPRAWVGYVGPEGLGIRGRYWQYEQTLASETSSITAPTGGGLPADLDGLSASGSGRLRLLAIDGEFGQRLDIGPWQGNLGGGVRYGELFHGSTIHLESPTIAPMDLASSALFHGIGPTLFVEMRRPLGASGFSLLANGRGSLLFGSTAYETASPGGFALPPTLMAIGAPALGFPAGSAREKRDTTVGIAEIQLGIEWAWRFTGGTSLVLQGLWEGQLWSGQGVQQSGAYNVRPDVGLMGFCVAAGISR